MHTHRTPAINRAAALTVLLTAIVLSTSVNAQTTPPTPQSVAPGYTPPVTQTYTSQPTYVYVPTRAGTWDFYLNVGYNMFDDTRTNNTGIYDSFLNTTRFGNLKFDFDDTFSFGLGFDYNLTDKLAIGAEFSYMQPDYDATFTITDPTDIAFGQTFRLSGEASVYTGDAFVQFNFSTGKLVPYVRANIGFLWLDTGIPTGPTEYWWWDWWWGGSYLVGETPTESDTFLTLGATAGLKYDFGNHVFATVAYTASWVDTSREWTLNQRVSLSVGWNY